MGAIGCIYAFDFLLLPLMLSVSGLGEYTENYTYIMYCVTILSFHRKNTGENASKWHDYIIGVSSCHMVGFHDANRGIHPCIQAP